MGACCFHRANQGFERRSPYLGRISVKLTQPLNLLLDGLV
jgi:hypothetical protein